MEQKDYETKILTRETHFDKTIESLEMVVFEVMWKVEFKTQEVEELNWSK